jgi:hypothetical protein
MWMWGWRVSADPQACSTAVMPTRAPRRLGSAAMVITVSAEARNSRSWTAFVRQCLSDHWRSIGSLHQAICAISAGRVKTRWKHSTGGHPVARGWSLALGQCRFLQELQAMWWWPHWAQPATCLAQAPRSGRPLSLTLPSAGPGLARRHAGPWARKMSAISSFGRGTPGA